LDALTIIGFCPCARSILRALGRRVLIFVEHGRGVAGHGDIDMAVQVVKLPQPQLRTRTYTQTGQSSLRATQVRAALSHAYAVTYQNRMTDKP
jgi:hypothetical protein